jgi:hypothetical protein
MSTSEGYRKNCYYSLSSFAGIMCCAVILAKDYERGKRLEAAKWGEDLRGEAGKVQRR